MEALGKERNGRVEAAPRPSLQMKIQLVYTSRRLDHHVLASIYLFIQDAGTHLLERTERRSERGPDSWRNCECM